MVVDLLGLLAQSMLLPFSENYLPTNGPFDNVSTK